MKSFNTPHKIAISRIIGHPNNPRTDLGDLSELKRSIAEHGILQDITVMPADYMDLPADEQEKPIKYLSDGSKKFVVIMGHRRLAALKEVAASLYEDVRCKVVWGLSKAEQIGIMLEENVQRNELTVPAQIEAFQLMLDLGETVESVAKKTGFSTTTIRTRVKNADVVEQIKDAQYQLTISDLMELSKLGTKDKEDVLKSVRSGSDLKQRVESRLASIERIEKQNHVIELLTAKGALPYDDEAKETYNWWQMDYVGEIRIDDPDLSNIVGDEFYSVPTEWNTCITVRRPSQGKEETEEEARERIEREREKAAEKERQQKIINICDRVKTIVKDYLKSAYQETPAYDESLVIKWLASDDDADIRAVHLVAIDKGCAEWQVSEEDVEEFYSTHDVTMWHLILASMVEELSSSIAWIDEYDSERAKPWRYLVEFLGDEFVLFDDFKDELDALIDGTSDLYKKE